MTVPTESGVPARGSLLRVSIDLAEPTLAELALNAKALNDLATFAAALTYSVDARQRHQDIRLVRMSMASPWVSILENLAEHSSPVGYSVTALYAMQQLLKAVMKWQNHRLDIAERELQLEALRNHVRKEVVPELVAAKLDDKREGKQLPHDFDDLVDAVVKGMERPIGDPSAELSSSAAPIEASTARKQDLPEPLTNSVAEHDVPLSPMEWGIRDVPHLGRVLAAEFISPDDSRLRANPNQL